MSGFMHFNIFAAFSISSFSAMGANCCCGVRQKEEERDAGSLKAKVHPAENQHNFSLRHLRLHRAALEQESIHSDEVPRIHLGPRRDVSIEELTDGLYHRSIHQDPANSSPEWPGGRKTLKEMLKRHPLKLKILAHELKDPLACGDRPTEAGFARFYIPQNTLHEWDLPSEDEMACSSNQVPNPYVDSDASDEEEEEEEEWENERAVFGLPLTYIQNREGDALDDDEDSSENMYRFQ